MNEEENKKVSIKETWKIIKKIWPYAKKHKKYLIIQGIVMLIGLVINVIMPLLTAKQILNLNKGLLEKLISVSLLILILEVTININRYITRKLTANIHMKILNDLQRDVTEETLKLDIKEIDGNSSGVFIDRLTKDARSLSDIINMIMFYVLRIFADIGIIGAIFIVNKIMFIYCVVALFFIFWIERINANIWFKWSKKNRELDEKNSGLIGELVRGIRDIKVLNSTKDFLKKVMDKIENANKEQLNLNVKQAKYNFISGSMQDIAEFLFIVLGVILIKTNNLTIDSLIVIYMYQSRMYSLLYSLTDFNEQLKKFNLSASRVFEIVDGKFKKEKFGKKHLDKIEGNFEFKNVTFSYDNKKKILRDMSFKVNANETVAFVGKSGSGKTTVFNLIDRLYKTDKGKITIDNIDINELDKDSIRDNISIITQAPYIFNFTIKENLKITKEDVTDEEIIEACKIAQLHNFIMTLPKKYDTIVGEGGVTLSGGQRQRLAIARALLKKTEIILFDEATSALDNETQKAIQKAINNMKGEYTILIIAHRLSTVIDSDRILLIDDGKVIDEGTHNELLKKNKLYKELYEQELE
ncbi:MAG: ABC transporter ATP-binding protein [Bacilli bacterium]|nr:ABC transporter ATP-binding protein [Bacilli bacterium]